MGTYYCKFYNMNFEEDNLVTMENGYFGEEFKHCRFNCGQCCDGCEYSTERVHESFNVYKNLVKECQDRRIAFNKDYIYDDCNIPTIMVDDGIREKCLKTLPQNARQILIMYYTCWWSVKGISKFYGESVNTVVGYLDDARSLFTQTYMNMHKDKYYE